MAHALIAGVGMTDFGKFPDRGLKSLASEAIVAALADAGLPPGAIEAAYVGNAAAPVITGQVMIAGQVILRNLGIGRIPVVNVENACATSATAFQQAERMIALGQYDVVLAAGVEKLFHADKSRTFSVFMGAVDVEGIPQFLASLAKSDAPKAESGGDKRSVFMDIYAAAARRHMERHGVGEEFVPRQFESPRTVSRCDDRRPGACSAGGCDTADVTDVRADRRWRCGRRAGVGAQSTRAGVEACRPGTQQRVGVGVGWLRGARGIGRRVRVTKSL
jgi:Thiolase, N-terminal domain